jgi:hypothetical protein
MADRILRLNDQGADVAQAQDLLNRAGAVIDDDGKFGKGTASAVSEFRAAEGLPVSTDIDAAVWAKLRALPLPNPDIPTRAVAFIAREEVSGRDFYDQRCARPSWPGGASGVTIGVGYDLGYQDNFVADWQGLLPPGEIARLMLWVGRRGTAAQAGPAQLGNIVVPWHAAWGGYIRRTLPQEVGKTRGAFVPPSATLLPPLCLGVLVSLVYNRGTSMHDDPGSDRRREMRQIRDAVQAGHFDQVPGALRSMCRLWPAGNGLRDRRQREAELFELGLANG